MSHRSSAAEVPSLSRRAWLAAAASIVAGALALPAPLRAMSVTPRSGKHPDPRPGIDASRIPAADVVRECGAGAVAAFDEARRIPGILDGIRCQCGCADSPDMRSVLSCYEGSDAMALHCQICQGEARLAARLHREGKTLAQIRAAIDKRYGG